MRVFASLLVAFCFAVCAQAQEVEFKCDRCAPMMITGVVENIAPMPELGGNILGNRPRSSDRPNTVNQLDIKSHTYRVFGYYVQPYWVVVPEKNIPVGAELANRVNKNGFSFINVLQHGPAIFSPDLAELRTLDGKLLFAYYLVPKAGKKPEVKHRVIEFEKIQTAYLAVSAELTAKTQGVKKK